MNLRLEERNISFELVSIIHKNVRTYDQFKQDIWEQQIN